MKEYFVEAIGALALAIAGLWKLDRKRLVDDLATAREETKAARQQVETEREETERWRAEWKASVEQLAEERRRHAEDIKRSNRAIRRARGTIEYQRGVVPSEPPPTASDWDEATEVQARSLHQHCAWIEREGVGVDDLLERYVDTTPPKLERP